MASVRVRNNFEFVRLAAALLVIFGHSYPLLGLPSQTYLGLFVQSIAVRIFFVVSGYLVCQSWITDPNIIRFVAKRCLRIFPALIAVVVLSICAVGPCLSTKKPWEYFADPALPLYLWNIALAPYFALPGVFAHNPLPGAVNGSLWTLPFEFVMYLTLPLYGSLSIAPVCRLLLPTVVVLSVGAATYIDVFVPDQVQPVIYWSSIPNLLKYAPYFVAGAAVVSLRLERFLNLQIAMVILVLLPILAGSDTFYRVVLLFVLPYAVLSFGLCERPAFWALQIVPDVSYGVYLWAFPVQQALVQQYGGMLSPLKLSFGATAVSLGLAYLSSRLIERPFLRLKPRHEGSISASSGEARTVLGSPPLV
jgi:peptidoglycan/LPS O-acetylase OafA/YrhL